MPYEDFIMIVFNKYAKYLKENCMDFFGVFTWYIARKLSEPGIEIFVIFLIIYDLKYSVRPNVNVIYGSIDLDYFTYKQIYI